MLKSVRLAALLLAFTAAPALAEMNGTLRIGVLNDMSSVYADFQGPGSVLAAQMAVEDFAKTSKRKVEVLSADHQNKPDVGSAITRRWFDTEGVDMIVDLPNSAVALAVSNIATEKNKVAIGSGAGTALLTGAKCSPNFVHWTYDTWAFGHGTARGVLEQGGKTWFFITADYAFGHSLEKNAAEFVKTHGGKVLGSVRHPLSSADFSSYLLQAQNSGAKVIGLANAGGDFTNAVKQAREFGVAQKGQRLVGLLVFDTDIKSLGLPVAQGMQFASGFYWDRDKATRDFSNRFYKKHKAMPTMDQAGAYSATMNYLKAIKAAGTDDPDAVIAKLKSMDISDFFAVHGKIRVDGRMVHDMYLMEVKKPAESKGEWDLLKIVKTIPGDQAFMPLSKSVCPLVKK